MHQTDIGANIEKFLKSQIILSFKAENVNDDFIKKVKVNMKINIQRYVVSNPT